MRRIINEALDKTRHILKRRQQALVAVSKALMEKEVIESSELAVLIQENSPGPVLAAGTQVEPKRPAAAEGVTGSDALRPAEEPASEGPASSSSTASKDSSSGSTG